jgi:hypothetical protein
LSLIYVRHNATGLEGWVYNRRIISFDKYEPVNSSLPVLYETNPIEETAGLPIFRIRDFNVRRGPSLDASILGYMSLSTRFAVTGRSIDGEWVTIVFLGSGAQGWISVTVLPESTLDIESLPVVE